MTAPADPLARFVEAQEAVYDRALSELRAGRKRSHWMWFIFPQLKGLGRSSASQYYGLDSAAEARLYLDHRLLGPRLRECVTALLDHRDMSAEAILGSIDAVKLRSSLTLFDVADGESGLFGRCLDAFFAGDRDPATLHLLDLAG